MLRPTPPPVLFDQSLIFSSAGHVHCIMILDAYQSYSNVLDMMKETFICSVAALKVAV